MKHVYLLQMLQWRMECDQGGDVSEQLLPVRANIPGVSSEESAGCTSCAASDTLRFSGP
jgi:hypothetical protein